METISSRAGVSFSIWDFGGGDKIRPLWKHHVRLPSGERPTKQQVSMMVAKYNLLKVQRRYQSLDQIIIGAFYMYHDGSTEKFSYITALH